MSPLNELKSESQKLAQARKSKVGPAKQRNLADQVINQLQADFKATDLANAFINNNIQSKQEALNILQERINALKNSNQQNKKTKHDIKKTTNDLQQVQQLSNRWINVTGNGKAKAMNTKMLIKAIQELEEYIA